MTSRARTSVVALLAIVLTAGATVAVLATPWAFTEVLAAVGALSGHAGHEQTEPRGTAPQPPNAPPEATNPDPRESAPAPPAPEVESGPAGAQTAGAAPIAAPPAILDPKAKEPPATAGTAAPKAKGPPATERPNADPPAVQDSAGSTPVDYARLHENVTQVADALEQFNQKLLRMISQARAVHAPVRAVGPADSDSTAAPDEAEEADTTE